MSEHDLVHDWIRKYLVRRHLLTIAGVALAVVCGHSEVAGCGACLNLGGSLTIVHPKSLQLAINIRRDIDAGLLKLNPVPEKKEDIHWRDLQTGRILAERFFLSNGFDLLLIEDGSHRRIESPATSQRGNRQEGTVSPPIRWVTGRAVLQSMLKNQLDLETAVKRGLIVVENTPANRDPRTRH
jgi:hypothetical protein